MANAVRRLTPEARRTQIIAAAREVFLRHGFAGTRIRETRMLRPLPDGRATLYDLGSSNGTFVNGQRIRLHRRKSEMRYTT